MNGRTPEQIWMRAKYPATGVFHLMHSSDYGVAACGRPIFDSKTEAADVAYIAPDGTFATTASAPPVEDLCVDCHAIWLERHADDVARAAQRDAQ
jgi:hypothetical protein